MAHTHTRSLVPTIVLHILLTAACNGVALSENRFCAKPKIPRGLRLLQSREHRDTKKELSDLVSRAYYINLETATDRRDSMEAQLQELHESTGLSYERFPAVYGKNDSWARALSELPEVVEPVIGTLGCFKSHVSVWRKVLADKPAQTWALVLEDDALLDMNILKYDLGSNLSVVPKDADIVLLGSWNYVRSSDEIAPGVYNASLPFFVSGQEYSMHDGSPYYYAGMHAYLIKVSSVNKVADQVMKELNMSYKCSYTPDCATHTSSVIHKYAIWPVIAYQAEFKSQRIAINDGAAASL